MDPIDILDNDFNSRQAKQQHITYGGFWIRTGALFIDGLLTSVVTIPIMYYNIGNLKSIPLLVISSLIGILYKPTFEFLYGATPGKMALKLRVVNTNFGKADFTAIFLRNIFGIVSSALALVFTVIIFSSEEFQTITGFFEYSTYVSNVKEIKYINGLNFSIFVAEIICLLTDPQKRALHDRIGRTYVIVEDPSFN
jgi:uncharacterized RDD family membrane protein YckC